MERLARWLVSSDEARELASFGELRRAFGSVDKVGRLYVFNVGGNKIRLIAAIHFNTGRVFIRDVISQGEDDAGAWKE